MPEQLDQDVVNLSKAIRQVESNKNPNAKGASGEFGYYQFMPETWASTTRKYLGREVPINQATPELQNEVAYRQIKEWKDAGYNPGQIASMWNAGAGKPNAYIEGNKGTNQYGVEYDTAQYAKNVAEAYQAIKGGAVTPTAQPTDPVAAPEPQYTIPGIPQLPGKKDLLQSATDVVTSIFPGGKIGEAIGTLGGYLATPDEYKKNFDLSAPTPLQVAGDAAQIGLSVAGGMPSNVAKLGVFGKSVPLIQPAATALGRIGQGAALGTGIGATRAIADGESVPDVIKQGLIGGAVGGVMGTAAEGVGRAANMWANKTARSFIPGTSDEVAKYAVSKGLGSPKSMLARTENVIAKEGERLGNILKSPQYKDVVVGPDDLYQGVANRFPDAGITQDELFDNLKRLVPLKRNLVTKLQTEGLSLSELHSLNSALGRSTFKTVFDDPTVKAGKEIGSAFYHEVSDVITGIAPQTEKAFKTLSFEYPLRKALEGAIRRGEKGKVITFMDIVTALGGSTIGPMGAVGGYAASRALRSPAVNLTGAGLLNNALSTTGGAPLRPYLTDLVTRGTEGLLNLPR